MLCYITKYVMRSKLYFIYNMCHVMFYNMCHVMLCYITCVMFGYITGVILCYIKCVILCFQLYNICHVMLYNKICYVMTSKLYFIYNMSCLTIIPRGRVGYEMIDSQRGA